MMKKKREVKMKKNDLFVTVIIMINWAGDRADVLRK